MCFSSLQTGIYVHVPFCRSRCAYCDFYSTVVNHAHIPIYLEHLKKEALVWADGVPAVFQKNRLSCRDRQFFQARAPQLKDGKITVDSIYFGGGTPSLLTGTQIQDLLDFFRQHFYCSPHLEVSLEANPDTIDYDTAFAYRKAGVNRLSIGIQSMSNHELQILERRSSEEQNIRALALLRSVFSNINADLMIGLPTQNIDSLFYTLEHSSLQELPHISCYMLSVPEKSRLQKKLQRQPLQLPTEKETIAMYRQSIKFFQLQNKIHYEISNFAKADFFCQHNLKYWLNKTYIGLGPSAGGYTGQYRYVNQRSLERWQLQIQGKKSYSFLKKYQVKDAILEDIMLQFRLLKGISYKTIMQWAEKYPHLGISARIERLVRNKWLKFSQKRLIFTRTGLLLANEVFKEFLD